MANNAIPYGVQDYKSLVEDGSVYIDKTPFMEKLEYTGRYNVFLRPRRFGKSLMTSVLYYYYDILSRDDFLRKITGLFNIFEDVTAKKEILESIIAKITIVDRLRPKIERDVISNKSDFVSLLYYLGFLTIGGESYGDVAFTTPNYTVEDTYFKYYLTYLERENNIRIDESEVRAFVKDLIIGVKYEKMKAFLEKQLKALSNRDYMEFDEKHVKLLLFASLRLSENYTVKSEMEVDEGYIDLALLPNFVDKLDNYYIIEFKYIKKTIQGTGLNSSGNCVRRQSSCNAA